jgi:hypothetical protein
LRLFGGSRKHWLKERGIINSYFSLGDELQGRLVDEMKEKSFFSLTIGEAQYYSIPRKGWEDILEGFPDTLTDVEEACKCFALSRYPAAVFHSIQMVEAGLIELGKFISGGP